MYKKSLIILLLSLSTIVAYNQTRNLDFYLKEGVQNSPLLNDLKNQVRSAVADSLLIRATKKPLLEAKSFLQYSPYYHNFGYDEVITDGGNYMAVMGVSQNIFNRRELDNKFKSAELQKQLAKNSSKVSVNELKKAIIDQYLAAYSDFSDLKFNRAFLELFYRENEIVLGFVKSGVGSQTDYLTLLIETQSQEIVVNQLHTQFIKNLNLLNQLCGIDDSASYELIEPELKIIGLPDITKAPSYIQYKIDSIRIQNEKLAIDIRYKPKISWFADAGFLSSTPWNFYQHFGYSAGVSLNVPIYDGKQREIEKQKLEFDESSRKMYETNYRNNYFLQIQQLSDELKALNEMSVKMEDQIRNSDQLVKALKGQLEAGNIQMTEYINAVKNFKTISRNINLVKIQKLQVINEMNFLLTQ
jgi:outer membrane protein TolC